MDARVLEVTRVLSNMWPRILCSTRSMKPLSSMHLADKSRPIAFNKRTPLGNSRQIAGLLSSECETEAAGGGGADQALDLVDLVPVNVLLLCFAVPQPLVRRVRIVSVRTRALRAIVSL